MRVVRGPAYCRAMNLVERLLADAADDPRRHVLAGDFGPVGLGDLADRVRIASSVLAAAGAGRGEAVLVALPERPSWVAAVLGAARIGAVPALVPHHLPGNRALDLIRSVDAAVGVGLPNGAPVGRVLTARDLRQTAAPGPVPAAQLDSHAPFCMFAGPGGWVVESHGALAGQVSQAARPQQPGAVVVAADLATEHGLVHGLLAPLARGQVVLLGGAPPSVRVA